MFDQRLCIISYIQETTVSNNAERLELTTKNVQ